MTTKTANHFGPYRPTREEQDRQDFVLAVKLLANGPLQARVRELAAREVEPAVRVDVGLTGATPSRRDLDRPLRRTASFRQWAAFTHYSQTMMWSAIEATVRRVAPEARARAARARSDGSLSLDPSLPVPTPIANTEIHRQPGGYVGPGGPLDLEPGLRYVGASRIYSPGKGNPMPGANGAARHFLCEQVRERFPGLAPRRVLDLGCGVGVNTQYVALGFPDAEVHGVDVAAGLLSFGHLLAAEAGLPIHYRQADAARTGFPDAHFDLIVSNILFHETNAARLPQILRECRRLLAPGGAMLHVDVATQVTRLGLADQVMNDWQVRWNGEPFWTAFAETDMARELVQAGFDATRVFAGHVQKPGAGVWYVFGASAPDA